MYAHSAACPFDALTQPMLTLFDLIRGASSVYGQSSHSLPIMECETFKSEGRHRWTTSDYLIIITDVAQARWLVFGSNAFTRLLIKDEI